MPFSLRIKFPQVFRLLLTRTLSRFPHTPPRNFLCRLFDQTAGLLSTPMKVISNGSAKNVRRKYSTFEEVLGFVKGRPKDQPRLIVALPVTYAPWVKISSDQRNAYVAGEVCDIVRIPPSPENKFRGDLLEVMFDDAHVEVFQGQDVCLILHAMPFITGYEDELLPRNPWCIGGHALRPPFR